MKTLNFKIATVFLVFVLLSGFIGCKKDAPLSRKDILTSHNWKFSSIKIDGEEVIEECLKDDFLEFESSGTVTYNNGTVNCYAEEFGPTGWWSISSDEKTLSVTFWGVKQGITIKELTESKMVLSSEYGGFVEEDTFMAF